MNTQKKAAAIIAMLTRYTSNSGYKTAKQLYDRAPQHVINAMHTMVCKDTRSTWEIENNMQSIEDRIKATGYRAKNYI